MPSQSPIVVHDRVLGQSRSLDLHAEQLCMRGSRSGEMHFPSVVSIQSECERVGSN
jgi:hypothetical protein